MECRILGLLEVSIDGVSVAVGGPKPRLILSILLLARGSVVSVERLSTALWGSSPPPQARSAIRAYVSRLRSVLEPLDGGARLLHRGAGYQLALAEGELDAVEFERLIGDARERSAESDHARALQLFDAALALWRGPPLIEFDLVDVELEADLARLADLRLVADEGRAEALLNLGRAGEVVADLEALVRRLPERERLAVLLMRALYADGRQSDALTVYRQLRRRLVEELGVEPSESTQAVHRQMLTHDGALIPAIARPPTNLPRRGTSFVGRDAEITGITSALREAALVTLTGVGGVGKSRLALEVAGLDRARFDDGVWLCELAPLAPGGPVAGTVAAALGLPQRHGQSIEQRVIEYLRGRQLLLVIDNCEHVLDEVSRLLAAVIADCAQVTVLATSREALGIEGEHLWPVPPLSTADAATLFVQRARASRPEFRSDQEADGAVAEICRRLDGLPLAIELAAARMRVMSAAEVAHRLDDGRLLTRGPRTAQPRHQSLTAAVDWSYRLLSPQEQALFTNLSVFAGGADLAAVHAVCAGPGPAEADTLDLLTALVDKSMVIAVSEPAGTRYRVLETLRAYGREHLTGGEILARRHARYFTELAERAARGIQGPDERIWVERTLPDADNFRSAFEQTMTERDVDLALRLVVALPEVSQLRLGFEAAGWAERAIDRTPPEHPRFAAAVGAAARGAWNLGDFARARRLAARAAGLVPERGTARSGYPADVVVDVALYEGDVAPALRHYTGAVLAARRADDPIRLVWSLYYVAICHAVRRTPELGLPAAQECLVVAQSTANPTAISMARYALALVLKKADPPRAVALFTEAAQLAASVHNAWWQGIAAMEAAATRGVHGDPGAAAAEFVAVLEHWERVGDRTQQWLNLRYIVRLLARLGADDATVTLHHTLLAAGKQSPLDPPRVGRLRERLGEVRFAAAAARGSGLTAAEAVGFAGSWLQLECNRAATRPGQSEVTPGAPAPRII